MGTQVPRHLPNLGAQLWPLRLKKNDCCFSQPKEDSAHPASGLIVILIHIKHLKQLLYVEVHLVHQAKHQLAMRQV